jgi:hypothetical protein
MLPSALRKPLSLFGQRRMKVERRGGKRVTPARNTLCLIRRPGEDQTSTVVVQNLSFKGIALLADRECPAGTVLGLLLINAAHTFSVEVDLQIVRCFRVAANQYFLAGPFGRALLHDELVPFIR